MSAPRGLARSFWLPAACLVAVEVYAGRFDGWGGWATAPLFLVPLVVSLVIAASGVVQCVSESRAGAARPSSIAFTVVAAVPFLWLLVRRHFV